MHYAMLLTVTSE